MFLAVALGAMNSMGWSSLVGGNGHPQNSTAWMSVLAQDTRTMVAQVLNSTDGWLYIHGGGGGSGGGTGGEWDGATSSQRIVCKASELLQQATNQEPGFNTTQEYLHALITPGALGGLYGGGPELTVLANIFRRPISIYELAPSPSCSAAATKTFSDSEQESTNPTTASPNDVCPVICRGTFGDGLFDDPCGNMSILPQSAVLSSYGGTGVVTGHTKATNWHLHVLVINVSPTEKHACVLIPTSIADNARR